MIPDEVTLRKKTINSGTTIRYNPNRSFAEKFSEWKMPLIACGLYAVSGGFLTATVDTTLPLWFSSPYSLGGLGFDTTKVGYAIASGGVAIILAQLLVSKKITNAFGYYIIIFTAHIFYSKNKTHEQ